jgi:RNA-binding protein
MLTSKQRAYLRSLATDYDTIVMIGKNGLTPEVTMQTRDALAARELIKGKVLVETSPVSPREAADALANETDSEVVQVIGSKFVLYKKKDKDPVIVLPKAPRK